MGVWIVCCMLWWLALCFGFRSRFEKMPRWEAGNSIGRGMQRAIRRHVQLEYLKGKKISPGMRLYQGVVDELRVAERFRGFWISSVGAGAAGSVLGMKLHNGMLSLLLAIAFALLPYGLLRYRNRLYFRDKHSKLVLVMANLQGEYVKSTLSFPLVVQKILPSIPEPLFPAFKQFSDTMLYLTPDQPETAYQQLDRDVDQYFFTEYLSLVQLVEEGEQGLKATMGAIPGSFEQYLAYNRQFARDIAQLNEDFVMMVLAWPVMLGFLNGISPAYFRLLLDTRIGQATMAVVALAFLVGGVLYMKENQPVALEL